MRKNPLLVLMLVLFLGYFCLGDDGSARRYAEFVEDDDLFRTFSLLERKDVQDELKMTPDQVAKVKHCCRPPDQEVPGLLELVASYRKQQSDPSLTESYRKTLRESFGADLTSCLDKYQHRELSIALSANQRQRLGELLIQMRGPLAVVDDAAVASTLRLSDRQMAQMREAAKDYEPDLRWLQWRYGRQQISDRRYKSETREDRQKEVEALFTVIRAIEKERDASLLFGLTPQQLAFWNIIQGAPFSIVWPPRSLYDEPFPDPLRQFEKEKMDLTPLSDPRAWPNPSSQIVTVPW